MNKSVCVYFIPRSPLNLPPRPRRPRPRRRVQSFCAIICAALSCSRASSSTCLSSRTRHPALTPRSEMKNKVEKSRKYSNFIFSFEAPAQTFLRWLGCMSENLNFMSRWSLRHARCRKVIF